MKYSLLNHSVWTQLVLMVSVEAFTVSGSYPLRFYAKDNTSYFPLCLMNHSPYHGSLGYFETSCDPVDFSIQNSHAFTNQSSMQGLVGFLNDRFRLGIETLPISLKLNRGGKVIMGTFYSCLHNDMHIIERHEVGECIEVEIFLLPYKEEIDSGLEPWIGNGGDEVDLLAPTQPLFFHAKIHGAMFPLYAVESDGLSLLGYGKNADKPVEFIFQHTYAFTYHNCTPGYLTWDKHRLSFGLGSRPFSLEVDAVTGLVKGVYHLCYHSADILWISEVLDDSGARCIDMELYVLALANGENRTEETGKIGKKGSGKKSGKLDRKGSGRKANQNTGNKGINSRNITPKRIWKGGEKSGRRSKFKLHALALYTKIDDQLVPFSYTDRRVGKRQLHFLSYGQPTSYPAEFRIYQNSLYYWPTYHREAVGFYEGGLCFGDTVKPVFLQSDSKGKVTNYSFFSCVLVNGTSNWIRIGDGYQDFDQCFRIEVYIYRLNRKTDLPLKPYRTSNKWT